MGYPRGSLTRVPVVDDVDSQQATRLSLREIWAGLVRPAFSDSHFWIIQAMVVTTFFIDLGGDLAQNAHLTPLPGFVWIVLLFVPVAYGGRYFGIIGSLGAALSGMILVIPEMLLFQHSVEQQLGTYSITAIMIIVAFVTGERLEEIQAIKRALAATDELFRSQQRSSIVFENSVAAICITDTEGNILEVNRSYCELVGLTKETITGQNITDLADPEHSVSDAQTIHRLVAGEVQSVNFTTRCLHKDGHSIWVDAFYAMVRDRGGVPIYIVASFHDITARRASLEALNNSEKRFRSAFDASPIGIALTSIDGRFLQVNSALCEMVGRDATDVINLGIFGLAHPSDRDSINQLLQTHDDVIQFTKRYLHADGHILHVQVTCSLIRDSDVDERYFISQFRDITEERARSTQLVHQALHDPLTGLANRALFEDRLSQVNVRSERLGSQSAVLLLDLDDFKTVNDTAGHHIGDQMLVELSRRLEKVTRSSDTLCRYAGDEFLYLAEGLESPMEAEQVADRLLSVIDEPFHIDGRDFAQHASIGVAVYGANGVEDAKIIECADIALYEAKRLGKGTYVVFTPEMNEKTSTRFQLIQELKHASLSNEFSMSYQAILDLDTESIAGFEASLRWVHPQRGLMLPDAFIPLAEQSDLVLELGAFALHEAISKALSWEIKGAQSQAPYVMINLTTRQFHDPNLVTMVDKALAASGIAPTRLILEFTEETALDDISTTVEVLENLKRLDVRTALRDFGAGYSSLSYLAFLQPSIVKVDQSITQSIHDTAVLETIVFLSHRLNLSVLAQGIETIDQLASLRQLGCDLGQGSLIAHVLP
ncbi:EAL domain-containing protein [Ferrimicrobium acidiphilum]|uniref:EAL domain-containing protein n=1 Tax=Ferrimicrobium acidiphilum TaxID=121039 RepID=UPI0023F3302F|nr:EAL domain-containing protein [Ferrimicrobium acidiphilum]